MNHSHASASASPLDPDAVGVSTTRLVATLALAGALAGTLIVAVFQWAQPKILTHQAEVLRGAVSEVLADPASTERFFIHDGALTTEPPAGLDTLDVPRVFLGLDEAGDPVGYAVSGAEPGFSDLVHVLFGYDPRSQRVIGMKVLENKETPGLGDGIVRDSAFVGGFVGVLAPIVGVKAGVFKGAEQEVAMITGATISSRTVIEVINHRIEEVGPLLAAHLEGREP